MRLLEEHLGPEELARLPDSAEALAAGTEYEVLRQHLRQCADCAGLAETHWALRELRKLMQQDEAEPIEGLASADPEWQRQMARRMMAESGVPSGIALVPRRRPVWFGFAVAAGVLCAVGLGGLGIWRVAHPSDARLLAEAYNKQRRVALRIPGAEPVALASGTRGASGLAEPTELLELRLRAQKHLEETPNSPYWHQVLGEVELLEEDGAAARRNFEIAQTTDEGLKGLGADLAAAWFEVGEKSRNAEAFGEAAELYSRAIKDDAGDAGLLYYNRALCWERQNLTENALDDLRAALKAERDPAWRKAIEAEIARVSGHAANADGDGYEAGLTEATQRLLPLWGASAEARGKIAATAEMGLRHRDRWLTDWIAASHAGANAEADGHLAAAAAAGAAGAAERALSEAKAAAGLYREVRNRPGMVRAELAETYALQRLGRAEECLESAAAVAREPLTKDYAWVAGQLLIEQSDCRLLEHRFAEAREDVERSLELTAAAGLPDLHLRALGTQAAVLNLSGRTAAAWQADATGLGLCQQAECSAIRKYQFLYDMVAEAQTLGLPNVASDLMRTTAGVAGRTGDATIHAYALEGLGTLAGRVGDYATSTRAFDEAAAKAEQLGPAARLYRADWQTDRAEILSRRGENAQALGVLQESSGVILASDYEVGRLHYLRAMAAVERAEGRTDEALASIQTAVREVDRSRELLHTTAERTQWSNASAPVYAELVKVYLARRQEDDALRAWERFRGAAYAPPAATPAKAAADARVLVLARVDDGYVGWLATVDPLHVLRTVRIGEGASLRRSAAAFYRLCADRGSAVADVKAVGGRLYGALIGPFERDLGGSRRIWIDADPSLAMLPFAALTTAKGEWLSDAMEIAVLPAWWSLDAGAATADAPVGAANSAVVVSAGTSYSEAAAIAKVFPHARVIDGAEATTGHVLEGLGGAEVFHFSGHATAARLMLVSGENAEPVLTAEALGSMHLRGCRIAVLAACNTTATDPDQIEELTDLRNAMLLAGAHTVVASSWDVDDRSTQALMVAFYKLLVAGRTPAQALGFAQQAVRSDDAWRHPYYWASFETFAN